MDPSAWWRFSFKVVVERLRAERGWRQAFPDITKRRRERYSLYVTADMVGSRVGRRDVHCGVLVRGSVGIICFASTLDVNYSERVYIMLHVNYYLINLTNNSIEDPLFDTTFLSRYYSILPS